MEQLYKQLKVADKAVKVYLKSENPKEAAPRDVQEAVAQLGVLKRDIDAALTTSTTAGSSIRLKKQIQSRLWLQALNVLAFSIHLVDGVVGIVLSRSGDPTVDVVAPLFEYHAAGSSQSFITPTPKVIFVSKILMPSVAVEFITAGFHLIYIGMLVSDRFDLFIRARVCGAKYAGTASTPSANPLRWVEYAITATLMSSFGSLAIGIFDFYYFLKNLATGVALQLCGHIIETLDWYVPSQRRTIKQVWNLGTLLNFVNVGVLLFQIFASKTHTNVFIYNTLPFAIYFNTFGIIAQLASRKYRQFADKYFVEKWYIILSLITKVAVFWLSYATYREIIEDNGFATRTSVSWAAVRWTAIGLPLGFAVWVAVYDFVGYGSWRVEYGQENPQLEDVAELDKEQQPIASQHTSFGSRRRFNVLKL